MYAELKMSSQFAPLRVSLTNMNLKSESQHVHMSFHKVALSLPSGRRKGYLIGDYH